MSSKQFSPKMYKRDKVVGIMGNIASGKSTLTRSLERMPQFIAVLEHPEECPYLEMFYDDPQRWAFHSKMWFLSRRFSDYLRAVMFQEVSGIVVFDGTIWDDLAHAEVSLRGNEKELYLQWFNAIKYIVKYDAIIYLHAPIDVLMTRMQNRGRDAESGEDLLEFLTKLQQAYSKVVPTLQSPVLKIDTCNVSFSADNVENELANKIFQLLE